MNHTKMCFYINLRALACEHTTF